MKASVGVRRAVEAVMMKRDDVFMMALSCC